MGAVRLFVLGGAVYAFFLLAFPEWTGGGAYHLASTGLVCLGAGGVFAFLKTLQVRSLPVTASYELGFLVAVLMYFLFTWPCKPLPIQQFGQGYRPTRADAAQGLRRLGLDPDSGAAKAVVSLFPKP
ncbi:MAG: hypothetical protein HY748_10930 [Elusimicrobia bacterium]|nr:hypothetical protein [Elusimicrobiota bacterium]